VKVSISFIGAGSSGLVAIIIPSAPGQGVRASVPAVRTTETGVVTAGDLGGRPKPAWSPRAIWAVRRSAPEREAAQFGTAE
jgi:hypothetical protein